MNLLILLVAFLVAMGSTLLFVPIVRRLALKHAFVDHPDELRKLHPTAVPNIGGIAIAAGAGIALFMVSAMNFFPGAHVTQPSMALLWGALAMVVTGFYDDIYGLNFRWKFFIQIVVAYLLVFSGYRIDLGSFVMVSEDPYRAALLSVPVTMFWIVGVINAVNLLDGLDGLAAGVTAIALAALALIAGAPGGNVGLLLLAVVMIGALAGFLFFNFSPASIFMGDSGSLFLGYMLAMFTLEIRAPADSFLSLLVPIVVLGVPVTDTILCMTRRILAGKSPFAPDRDHIHHRLSKMWSERRTVLILYGTASWFGATGILICRTTPAVGYGLLAFTALATLFGLRLLGYLGSTRFIPDSRDSQVRSDPSSKRIGADIAVDTPRRISGDTVKTRNVDTLGAGTKRQHQIKYQS